MKLTSDRKITNSIKSGDFKSSKIEVSEEDSAMIGQVLRDKIYSDKELAVVREYIANGLDEHVNAKNADPSFDKKLKIKIPLSTDASPFFSVRDYAFGLDDEGVRRIFGMYFKSTKKSTNDLIGGYGVGSKAGHAYTNTFYVTSWHGGKKTLYSFIIEGDSSAAEILEVSKVDSDEPTGIEVKVPVEQVDAYKFQRAFDKFYPFIKNKVESNRDEYNNDSSAGILDVQDSYLDTDIRYPKSVLCGFIPYKISDEVYSSAFNNALVRIEAKYNCSRQMIYNICFNGSNYVNGSFILRANIGDVDIAISREYLDASEKNAGVVEESAFQMLSKKYKDFCKKAKKVEDADSLREFNKSFQWVWSKDVLLENSSFFEKLSESCKSLYNSFEKFRTISIKVSSYNGYASKKGKVEMPIFDKSFNNLVDYAIDSKEIKYSFFNRDDYDLGKVAMENRIRSAYMEVMSNETLNVNDLEFTALSHYKPITLNDTETQEEREEARKENLENLKKHIKAYNKLCGQNVFEEYKKSIIEHKPVSAQKFISDFLGEGSPIEDQDKLFCVTDFIDYGFDEITYEDFPKNGILVYCDKINSSSSGDYDKTYYAEHLDASSSLKGNDGGGDYHSPERIFAMLKELEAKEVYVCRRGTGMKIKKHSPLFADIFIEEQIEKQKIRLKRKAGKVISEAFKTNMNDNRIGELIEFNKFLENKNEKLPKTKLPDCGSARFNLTECDGIDIILSEEAYQLYQKLMRDKGFSAVIEKTFNRAKAKMILKNQNTINNYKKEIFNDKKLLNQFKVFIMSEVYRQNYRIYSHYSDYSMTKYEEGLNKVLDKI